MHSRWFASLLTSPVGATSFLREHYPSVQFHLEKRVIRSGKMLRWVRFDLDGKTILRARSIVDLEKSNPAVSNALRKTNQPIGAIVKKYAVKRTRLKTTTRSRSFHFLGDLHAYVWERFYLLPRSTVEKKP